MFLHLSACLARNESVSALYSLLACNMQSLFKSHQGEFFLVFSSGVAIHQSLYSLLDVYIPRNFKILSCDFVSSQISSNCSNDGFGDAFSGVTVVIFHHSIAASKDTFEGSGYNVSCDSCKC